MNLLPSSWRRARVNQASRALGVLVRSCVLALCGAAAERTVSAQTSGQAPMITVSPIGGTFIIGTSPSLRAAASGATAYRWTHNGDTVEGAASAELVLTNLQAASAGSYRLTVSNAFGSTQTSAALVETVERAGVVSVAAAEGWSFWLRSDGLLFHGGLDPQHPSYPLTHWASREVPTLLARDVVRVAAAEYQAFYITLDGKLWAWGSNAYGQLGDGTQERRNTPVPVADGVVAVAAGRNHTLFIKNDGTLWGMGRNHQGQLGDGTRIDRHRAVLVAYDVASVSAGLDHSALLKADGTLWTTGAGARGALADGQTVSRSDWRQVSANVRAVSAGAAVTFALKRDGSLWAAGANTSSELGDGTTIDHPTLVQVASDVDSVSTCYSVTAFVKLDGSLWSIGGNSLLFAAHTLLQVPAKVAGGSFRSVALSSGHALLIDRAGTAFALGGNAVGSLGLGHRNQITQATVVIGGPLKAPSGVVDLAVGVRARGDGVALRWQQPLGAERFEVWRSATNDSATAMRIAQGIENAAYVDFTAVVGSVYYYWVTASNAQGTSAFSESSSNMVAIAAPRFTRHPADVVIAAGAGSAAQFTAEASSQVGLDYQWRWNGIPLTESPDVTGVRTATLSIGEGAGFRSGLVDVIAENSAGAATSQTARYMLLGSALSAGADAVGSDIVHPNGNVYDQYLVTTSDVMVRADPGQVVRTSFVDLSDDIVQVEFAGAGTLTITLENASGPALPANYNQAVNYMKGHARIVVAGADETTNLSVFSVGRFTAVNQTLFKESVSYDGHADLASISILSANGKFGGLRTSNASYFATAGLTGVYAPGVTFTGPVFIGELSASDAAQPVIRLGAASDVRITGGDLAQANGAAVDISGISLLKFTSGQDSHGRALPARANKAKLTENGTDVTSQVVVNPGS